MDRILRAFYNNESEREAVRAFMVETLRELAADRALKGEPTEGVALANKTIDHTFAKLQTLYGKIEDVDIANTR